MCGQKATVHFLQPRITGGACFLGLAQYQLCFSIGIFVADTMQRIL